MNPVVHFEMPAENQERMAEFYTRAFGWQIHKLGPEMGNYMTVATAESDPADPSHRPLTPGTINGGFYQKTKPDQVPSVVIAVPDIQAAMKAVVEAGGKITGGMKLGEPDDIPGVGFFIAFEDTEGNRVALLQPKSM